MIFFSPNITPRLGYACDFAGKEISGKPFHITDDKEEFIRAEGPKINYSHERITAEEFWLLPHPLLFETVIRQQAVDCFELNGSRAFFKTEGDFSFDIFAASFYLLSRYEEYLPHQKDMYGRYAHQNSLAYKEGFLNKPLINIWLHQLRHLLQSRFPGAQFLNSQFTFIPTYDIDEAFSFKYKQWWRSAGAVAKDLLAGKFDRVAQRRNVLNNNEADPFDSYAWMDDLHRLYQLSPRYFFLVPERNGKYDRNILPEEPVLQTLIREHADRYEIGIHPSWQSGDNPELIRKEKETLENIATIKITASRQHFIRFTLPQTFRQLVDAGIREDFSMGYGSINGFRASVASPFYWYDLEKEHTTGLLLYPFCYMEANSFFEQKYSPTQALDEMYHYYNEVKKVNGTLISIWHNTFLGTDKMFDGWREVYKKFLHEVTGQTDTASPG